MHTAPSCGIEIWTERTANVGPAAWKELACLLDDAEKTRARQYRFDEDRQAYVLAHALRRLALGKALAVNPASLAFGHDAQGKPGLTWPVQPGIFFSHAHARSTVACAVTWLAPVGVDVEDAADRETDLELLAPFVAVPDARQRNAELGPGISRQFLFYWTALEAFWKAAGTGLVSANPRIRCNKNAAGLFEVSLDRQGLRPAQGCVFPIASSAECAIAVALQYPLRQQERSPGSGEWQVPVAE